MKQHIHLLGLLFVIYGAMGVVGAGIVFLIFVFGGVIAGVNSDAHGIAVLTGVLGITLATIVIITNLPALITGWGLMKYKSWSRVVGIVVGILCLFAAPFGTALGIYALWVLFKDESRHILEGWGTTGIKP